MAEVAEGACASNSYPSLQIGKQILEAIAQGIQGHAKPGWATFSGVTVIFAVESGKETISDKIDKLWHSNVLDALTELVFVRALLRSSSQEKVGYLLRSQAAQSLRLHKVGEDALHHAIVVWE